MNRREFLRATAAVTATSVLARFIRAAEPNKSPGSSRITHVSVQVAPGRRLTPVAPNAYAKYRGFDVKEPVVRVRTADGLEGIGRMRGAKPDALKRLIGMDPYALYEWDGETVKGSADGQAEFLQDLAGCDGAVFDLLGKAMHKPVADLLGKRVRETIGVYDSSLYMEDLLKPEEREGLAYLNGKPGPDDPAELVALKSKWVVAQPGGINILKIKLGRVKWMLDMAKSDERDIAVVKAVRNAVGPDVKLLVDFNNGYKKLPTAAFDFAVATKSDQIYWMEEMFPEQMVKETREVKQRMRAAGMANKLADGESEHDGIDDKLCAERLAGEGSSGEALFNINQPDMNENGFLRMRAIAIRSARHGMTVSPHNFGSKWGLFSMVHLGLVVPNWEFCETDDSQFPALHAEGIVIEKGQAKLVGMPGVGVTLDEAKLEKPMFTFDA